MGHVSHGLLRDGAVEKRLYQLNIASTASRRSCLVVLPTGLGKTAVALLVAANRLSGCRGPALMLAPTKPLIRQHAKFFEDKSHLETEVLTGETVPDEREGIWSQGGETVFFATPQVVENDAMADRCRLRDMKLVVFDEAHRASGEYPYTWLASKYLESAEDPLSLGLTASPGNGQEDVERICKNLHLEKVEVRSDRSPDVSPYVQRREVDWVEVELPEKIAEASGQLKDLLEDRLDELDSIGVLKGADANIGRGRLLDAQRSVQKKIASQGDPPGSLFKAASLIAEGLKVRHGIDVIETQGPGPGLRYLERIAREGKSSGGSKAAERILGHSSFTEAKTALENHDGPFPKLERLKELLEREISRDSRAIVFTNYRDTAATVVDELKDQPDLKPVRFVGQSSKNGDNGLKQGEQVEVLDLFESGEYNVLVGTSVAEEGLDIPSTDLVVFYEPVASAIRTVQRKGRTGRTRKGRILVLMTKGTKDEGAYWASKRREDRMEGSIARLEESVDEIGTGKQTSLGRLEEQEEEGPAVIVDHRESRSGLSRSLDEKGLKVELSQLNVADVAIGGRVGIERKEVDDFVSSFLGGDNRLFRQASELSEEFERPLMIIEGGDLYGSRNVHPNAIRGALASLVVDFGTTVLRTDDRDETASVIASMAKREASKGTGRPALHGGKSRDSLQDQQLRMVSSVKGVGPDTAVSLLRRFGSIRRLADSSEGELLDIDGVGKRRAEKIVDVFSKSFDETC